MQLWYYAFAPVFILAFLASLSPVLAQFIYTDIEPDTVISARAIGDPGEYNRSSTRRSNTYEVGVYSSMVA